MLNAHLMGFQTLQGRRVSLHRRAPAHAAFLRRCLEDAEFMALYRLAENRNLSETEIAQRLAQEYQQLPENLRRFEWIIERHARNGAPARFIGLAAVADYLRPHQRGEFLIGIQDATEQKTGVGLEASLLVMDFAFNQLKLHKFISFVYGFNPESQKNTLHLGFIQEGFLRDHIHNPQRGFVDLYQNGMTVADFRSNQRLARLSRRLLGRDITCTPPAPEPLPPARLAEVAQLLKKHHGSE